MHYSPGEVADKTGFSIDTLRYYEREGILSPVARTAGGRRAYSDDDLGRLGFLRCLRDTGMPIVQLRQHLAVLAQFDNDWGAAELIRSTLAPFRPRG